MQEAFTLLIIVLLFQAIFDLVIIFWLFLKLGEVLKELGQVLQAQKKMETDINNIGRLHRVFKGKIEGLHNRFVTKISTKFREVNVHTDFSDEMIRDD